MGYIGQVRSGVFLQGRRRSRCNFSGNIVGIAGGTVGGTVGDFIGDTKYKPVTVGSAKRDPNNGTKENGTLGGS